MGLIALLLILWVVTMLQLRPHFSPASEASSGRGSSDASGLSLAPEALQLPAAPMWSEPSEDELAKEVAQFQLTGTFQRYEFNEDSSVPQAQGLALIDLVEENRQMMLKEGMTIGAFSVKRIGTNEVTLQRGEREWVLRLPGAVASVPSPEAQPLAEEQPRRFEDMPALESSPFGKKISDNQWVIQREAIEEYAGQIMQNPVRAVQLYGSFSQTAQNPDDVHGYQIGMKGEQELFQSMGLQDGDVIRKVNSMKMKNQRRAEYLIGEFMKNRMSAVVLDIERNGENVKQVYIIR